MWLLTLKGRLTTVTLLSHGGPILDIGCGTGVWALAIAKELSPRQIIATDLTPPNIPTLPNLMILESNAENEWTFNQRFSFIRGRMLASGIRDWTRFLEQCFKNLEPGGWLELLDISHPFAAENHDIVCQDGSSSSDFLRWGQAAEKPGALNGLDYRATTKHVRRCQELGLVDINETVARWQLGTWPEDDTEKHIGELTLSNFIKFLTMAGVGIIKQNPNIGEQEAQSLVTMAVKDLVGNCNSRRFYLTMYGFLFSTSTTFP